MVDYQIFLVCFAVGTLLGAFWGFLNFVKLLLKNNVIINNILSFFYSLIMGAVILVVVIELNFGDFRLYLFLAFALGIWLERKTMGKIFAKFYVWLYNKLNKILSNFAKTKFAKRVLK